MEKQKIILQHLGGQKFLSTKGAKDLTKNKADLDFVILSLKKNNSGANRLLIYPQKNNLFAMDFHKRRPARPNRKYYKGPIIESVICFHGVRYEEMQDFFLMVIEGD